jgi:RimJ/RimL family protein N-acetyltransferase
VKLRPVVERDARLLWVWANDPGTRAASYGRPRIPWTGHQAWLRRVLKRRKVLLFIAEAGRGPVGHIRFESTRPEIAVISLVVAPEARGKGRGAEILRRACPRAMTVLRLKRLLAWVMADNEASLRTFAGAGFRRVRKGLKKGAPSVLFTFPGG